MITIQPVILCGGSGTRLWPISTAEIPKQFISLGNGTLLEETIRRVDLILNKCKDMGYGISDPLLIMNRKHTLPSNLSKYESNIVYETHSNDTAVAITRSVLEIKSLYGTRPTYILVMPADHYMHNVDAFVNNVCDGISHVTQKNIVLYGIDPTGPETKYGYIIPSDTGIKFKEKPNMEIALDLIQHGAMWNSGMFISNLNTIYDIVTTSPYDIMSWIEHPKSGKGPSFDVAVLQEYKDLYACHCTSWAWSDVGTWKEFIEIPEIINEIHQSQGTDVIHCTNVKVINRSKSHIIIIGCDSLLISSIGDNILIMSTTNNYDTLLKDAVNKINTTISII